MSVKYLKRLKIAYRMVHYYEFFSVDMMAPKLLWMVLDNFEIQRYVMATNAKKASTYVTKLGNNTTVAKWNNTITFHAGQVFGSRKSTIKYLLRDNAAVVEPHLPLLVNRPH